MRAAQQCAECGSPLTPCLCDKPKQSRAWNSTLPVGRFMDVRTEERYGPAWEGVKARPCIAWELNYYGAGHECCGYGEQGGHTAHHLSRLDRHGLLPCCGKAHDLLANRGSRGTQRAWRAFLAGRGIDLGKLAKRYYEEANDDTLGR